MVWVLTIWLLLEAFWRIMDPPTHFDAKTMLITSIIGVVCNIIMGMTLHQELPHSHGHGTCEGHGHAISSTEVELEVSPSGNEPYVHNSNL